VEHKPSELFAARLKETRKARGLSQTELARRMTEGGRPMSKPALLRIEKGERKVSLDEALAFASVLWAVPANLLSPAGDDLVMLTDRTGMDGGALRSWLIHGNPFTGAPDEGEGTDLARAALLIAQALVDANRVGDTDGKQHAVNAIFELGQRARQEESERPTGRRTLRFQNPPDPEREGRNA